MRVQDEISVTQIMAFLVRFLATLVCLSVYIIFTFLSYLLLYELPVHNSAL